MERLDEAFSLGMPGIGSIFGVRALMLLALVLGPGCAAGPPAAPATTAAPSNAAPCPEPAAAPDRRGDRALDAWVAELLEGGARPAFDPALGVQHVEHSEQLGGCECAGPGDTDCCTVRSARLLCTVADVDAVLATAHALTEVTGAPTCDEASATCTVTGFHDAPSYYLRFAPDGRLWAIQIVSEAAITEAWVERSWAWVRAETGRLAGATCE